MKIEDQVCSKEQGRKLFELEVLAAPLLAHSRICGNVIILAKYTPESVIKGLISPAYTVAELGILLGKYIVMKYASDKCWRLYDEKGILREWISQVDNEAQARAAALIWLIENDFVIPGELKL